MAEKEDGVFGQKTNEAFTQTASLKAAVDKLQARFFPSDTSMYVIEERLIVSVWDHEKQRTGETYKEIRENFFQRFNKATPSEANLQKLEKKTFFLQHKDNTMFHIDNNRLINARAGKKSGF